MKNTFFLFICCVFAANLSATVRTVSNAPNAPAQYQTIQAAVDAAVAGDVILVEGTGTLYDAPNVSKQLDFKAAGFNPGTFNHRKAMMTGTFKLLPGADGSIISGFGSNGTGWSIEVNCPNVRIEKNELGFVTYTVGGTWGPYNLVNGEIILSAGSNGTIIQDNVLSHIKQTTTETLDVLVQHNMFFFGVFQASNDHYLLSGLTGSYIFRNNYFQFQFGVFITSTYNGIFAGVSGLLFENNIFSTSNAPYGNMSSCVFNNNMTDQPSLPMSSGSNNLFSVSPDFVKTNTTFFLNDFRLKTGTAGKNAGTDGQDLGVHTATHQFSMTGEPAEMPVIRSITLSNENVPPNSSFQVKIVATKAKSN
jgi:hypothetical protein